MGYAILIFTPFVTTRHERVIGIRGKWVNLGVPRRRKHLTTVSYFERPAGAHS